MRALILAAAVVAALAGCGGGPNVKLYKNENFQSDASFSKTIPLASGVVCRNVKRALLSQGYVIEQTPATKDSPFLAASKNWQPEDDVAVTLRLQVTCVHEDENSSTVFATAVEEGYKLQTVQGSVAAGVSVATVTLPAMSGRQLMLVRRETIQDPQFYARFYDLVQKYAEAEQSGGPPPIAGK
jgi:Uncharacterized protein conserved in bacteria (DUF2242)